MGFWDIMVKKDDWIVSTVETFRNLKNELNPKLIRVRKKIKKTPPMGKGKCLYILLNAPSLKTQDISVLKGKDTMFVNRGFMHPLFKELQPKYHVFVDTKMLKGIWPVSWIDEILNLSPNTTIILPWTWYNNPLFKSYIDKGVKIYWSKNILPFNNLGVSGECFSFGIKQEYDKIYFSGFDATGIGHEMVKSANSHFYGDDKELEGKSTKQFVIDLLMHSRHLHDLNRLAEYCKKHDIKIINITNGGLLDMFPREKILPLLD